MANVVSSIILVITKSIVSVCVMEMRGTFLRILILCRFIIIDRHLSPSGNKGTFTFNSSTVLLLLLLDVLVYWSNLNLLFTSCFNWFFFFFCLSVFLFVHKDRVLINHENISFLEFNVSTSHCQVIFVIYHSSGSINWGN